jgi:predicted type IV restriction endonuclease
MAMSERTAMPSAIAELVSKFREHAEVYRSGKFNETQTRREFIDPFFEELGWDISNRNGYAEAYKEVIHEDAVRIGGTIKSPDYSFRIGGVRKFLVEAKKPSVNIKSDLHPAFQLRRYAWSAKLPVSIVTDFEEFAVYDCSKKPKKTDRAAVGRLLYMTFEDYSDRWHEIADLFSKESILKGGLDRYSESLYKKRGTSAVDDEFLKEIEGWREVLAKNIALRNNSLTRREINFGVQRAIDRIIFLRICEDRAIEPYGRLLSCADGADIYSKVFQLFQQADDRFNSGLFHFKKEKGRSV